MCAFPTMPSPCKNTCMHTLYTSSLQICTHEIFDLIFFVCLFKNLFPTSYHKTPVNSEIKMQFQIRKSALLE